MMEMNGRDSAKCQKSKLRDMIVINWILNKENDKSPNIGLLLWHVLEFIGLVH